MPGRTRTMRFTMSSHFPPLVRGAQNCSPLVQEQWRAAGAGNIFQFFGHIPAQPAQFTATMGAFCTAGGQIDLYMRNVIRDRLALRVVGGGILRQTRSSRRWRSRAPLSSDPWRTMTRSPAPVATARMSRMTPRTDGRAGPPVGACPALALRAFIPSIRPLDGSILLRRAVLHSRSEPPATLLRPTKLR